MTDVRVFYLGIYWYDYYKYVCSVFLVFYMCVYIYCAYVYTTSLLVCKLFVL